VEDLRGFHGISGGFRGFQGTSGALKIWPGLTASLKCHLHLCGFGAAPMASSLLSLTTLPACNSQLATCNSCCSDPPFPRIGLLYKACTFLFLCFFFLVFYFSGCLCLPKQNAQIKIVLLCRESNWDIASGERRFGRGFTRGMHFPSLLLLLCLTNSLDSKFIGHLKE